SPQYLPDGRHFLYFVQSPRSEYRGIYIGSLDSKESRHLVSTEHNGAYAASSSGPGHLLFLQGVTLMAQPFDTRRLELTDKPYPVAEGVWRAIEAGVVRAGFTASGNRALAYLTGGGAVNSELVWFDRQGRRLERVAE